MRLVLILILLLGATVETTAQHRMTTQLWGDQAVYKTASLEVPPAVAVASDATCRIHCPMGGGFAAGGSGTYFTTGNGRHYVLTAWHVTDQAISISCTWWNGHKTSAKIVATDQQADIQILEIASPPSGIKPAKLIERDLVPGEAIYYVGYAQTHNLQSLETTFQGAHNDHRGTLNRGSIPGMSGGPIFTADGRLASAISATDSLQRPTETYFGLPSRTIRLASMFQPPGGSGQQQGQVQQRDPSLPARPFGSVPRAPGEVAPGGSAQQGSPPDT